MREGDRARGGSAHGDSAHCAEGLERRVMLSSAIAAFGGQQTFGVGLVPQTVAVAAGVGSATLTAEAVNASAGSVGSRSDTAAVWEGSGGGVGILGDMLAAKEKRRHGKDVGRG